MKRIFQLCFSLAFFSLGFSQNLKPIAEKVKNVQAANKTFVKYNLFTVDPSAQKQALYQSAADGITVMKLNKTEVQRINSERPEAMEEASVMMVGMEKERIMQGLAVLETQEKDTLRHVADYSMPNVSDKVVRIIHSYTDYVNRVVWKKY